MEDIKYLVIMTSYPPAVSNYGSLRIDNVNCPVTSTSTNVQGTAHELITHPTATLPHLSFKNALLKPFREFRVGWGARATSALTWPRKKLFSVSNSYNLVFFDHCALDT